MQRCFHFSHEVDLSEVKCSLMASGNGPTHSDGAGKSNLTACKMIMKPRAGGTLMTQGDDGQWRFVALTPKEYVLLSTKAGARLHCAAHLELVEIEDDGRHVFRAATENAAALSIIMNLGSTSRGEQHQGSFVDAAQRFASGAECPEPRHCSVELAEKADAWPKLMDALRDAAARAAARAAEDEKAKEARAVERAAEQAHPNPNPIPNANPNPNPTLTPTRTRTRTLTLTLIPTLTLTLTLPQTLALAKPYP